MEAYLEDNRPSLDEVCEAQEKCTEKCPAYRFCNPHNIEEDENKLSDGSCEKCGTMLVEPQESEDNE